MFQLLAPVVGWAFANSTNMFLTTRLLMGAKEGFRNLSPATKAQVDAILTQTAPFLLKMAVGDVLDLASSRAVAAGLNPDAVNVVKFGIKRVSEVGLDKVRKELQG